MLLKTCVFLLSLITLSGAHPKKDPLIISSLETYTIETGKRKTVYTNKQHFEAPNWSRDGKFLIYNSDGKIYRINAAGGKPQLVNTSFAQKCNNDHGISPDNSQLVVSHNAEPSGKSLIYILPISGGEPKQITPIGPSYWHGWSPDGKTLAYCAERNGEYDIYTIPVSGGEEKRLTSAAGLDDGPDYTADGKYIYFNSLRTGKMKIWRMLTYEYNDWFPHPSPDGKWLVFVSYEADVEGHPANKNVSLRLMPLAGGQPKVIAKLFGGQGTINVPSWSPDSKQFAFVSYKLIK
jgi:Tol biopolymer transport system component